MTTPTPVIPARRHRRTPWLIAGGLLIATLAWQAGERLHAPPPPPRHHTLPPDTGLAQVRSSGIMRIAVDASYPPFAVTAADGSVHGFDVDLGNAISAALTVRADFVNMGEDGIPDALIAGKVDIAIADMAPDPRRTLGYSIPYYNAGEVLLVPGSDTAVQGLASLGTAPIGVELGSQADEWLRSRGLAPPRLRRYDAIAAAVTALEQGTVAAVVTDGPTAADLLQHGAPLRLAGPPLTVEPYVVATAPQNRSLVLAVNTVLLKLDASGTLPALVRRDV